MEDYFKNLLTKQEKLDVKVELAKPEDWVAFKNLRIEAINSEDVDMFDVDDVKKDKVKTDLEWQEELLRKDAFYVFARNGEEVIGMGRATDRGEGIWSLGAGYVRGELQSRGIGKQVWAARIEEIKKRGGVKVVTGIKYRNIPSLKVAESLGFKKVGFIKRVIRTGSLVIPMIFQGVELDLNNKK